MSEYDDIEASASDGSKVEIFLFEMPGTSQYWAHTTNAEEVTVSGKTYTPCPISRSEIDTATGEFQIELPYDHPVVLLHVPYLPPRPVTVTVSSYHRGSTDVRRVQIGAVYRFEQKGVFGILHCTEPDNPMSKLIPRASYGPNCRHVTYGLACTLDKEDFKTVIDDIVEIVDYVITSPKAGLTGSGWFKYGYAVNPDSGEVRFITDHVGNDVTLVYPFIDIDTSTVLHFFAGDDFKPETCRVKFNNKINYLGFDFHPKYNIFSSGWRAGGYNNETGTGPGTGRIRPT